MQVAVRARPLAPQRDRESWRAPSELAGHVLLVDDEPLLLKSVERMLLSRGLPVLLAFDGPGALREAARVPELALLVTDIRLPGMDGFELAERLRKRLPRLKVLFMSGFDADPRRGALPDDGSWTFLPKPFTGRELDRRLGLLLGPSGAGVPG
jgi:two-component system cell cycle sensor histidine kinase/response regulator CckA